VIVFRALTVSRKLAFIHSLDHLSQTGSPEGLAGGMESFVGSIEGCLEVGDSGILGQLQHQWLFPLLVRHSHLHDDMYLAGRSLDKMPLNGRGNQCNQKRETMIDTPFPKPKMMMRKAPHRSHLALCWTSKEIPDTMRHGKSQQSNRD